MSELPENTALHFLREWWGIFVFAATTFAAFIAGRERTRYQVHEVGDKVDRLTARVEHLEKVNADQTALLAAIRVDLEWLKRASGGQA